MKDEKPKLDSIASILPHDQHAIIFSTYSSMLKQWTKRPQEGSITWLDEGRAEKPAQRKIPQQLCLPVDEFSRILGPKLISSVAITGSDPFLRTGTSLTLIFEAKQKEGLLAALALRRMQQRKIPSSQESVRQIPKSVNHKYEGIASPTEKSEVL